MVKYRIPNYVEQDTYINNLSTNKLKSTVNVVEYDNTQKKFGLNQKLRKWSFQKLDISIKF